MNTSGIVYMRCLKCNKLLKSDESKRRGYGDFCWKQHLDELRRNSSNLFSNLKINGGNQ